MISKNHDYQDGSTVLKGYLSYQDANSPQPAVLICPDWTGRSTFSDNKANQLAKLGYVGFSLDVYGEGRQGETKEQKSELMQPFMQDRALLRRRLLAAFHAAQQLPMVDPKRIAVIGYCFGGLCALDLARSGAALCGAISFHGLLMPPVDLPTPKVHAKVLAFHGYNDPMVPPTALDEFANEMTSAHVDWQLVVYGNTMHAFTNPSANDPGFGTVYNKSADQRAWRGLTDFLTEIFTV